MGSAENSCAHRSCAKDVEVVTENMVENDQDSTAGSDAETAAVTVEDGPAEKKRRNVTPPMEKAIREVLARVARGLRHNYKAIAAANGVTWQSLQSNVCRANSGKLVLSEPKTIEEKAVNKRVELGRSLALLTRVERLLNDTLQSLVLKAEHWNRKGKLHAYRDLGIPAVVADLASVTRLQQQKEQGYLAILEADSREKKAKSATDVQSEVMRDGLTDDERAREALKRKLAEKAAAAEAVTLEVLPDADA